MKKFLVQIKQNLTACSTIQSKIHRTIYEEIFDSETEALNFYNRQKSMQKFAGLAGQYVTYPMQVDETYIVNTHFCDECDTGFNVTESDLGFSDLPNGNFCSRTCFRNNFQETSNNEEQYYDDY